MKGFIEVTRFMGRDDRGLPAMIAVDTIVGVCEMPGSGLTEITLSVMQLNPVDAEKPGANETLEIEESYEVVQEKMAEAAEGNDSTYHILLDKLDALLSEVRDNQQIIDSSFDSLGKEPQKVKNLLRNDVLPAIETVQDSVEQS